MGNEYLRKAIPEFNQAFEGKWISDNQFTPWDRGAAKIVAAVQAECRGARSRGPSGLTQVNDYYKNGTVQDLTDWAKAHPWYLRDGRQRGEDVHRARRQALLYSGGLTSFHGLRLEGSLPQRLPKVH